MYLLIVVLFSVLVSFNVFFKPAVQRIFKDISTERNTTINKYIANRHSNNIIGGVRRTTFSSQMSLPQPLEQQQQPLEQQQQEHDQISEVDLERLKSRLNKYRLRQLQRKRNIECAFNDSSPPSTSPSRYQSTENPAIFFSPAKHRSL
ncbi:hypothetical protein [Absidia glauca]|uniref:Uncharacterized protein n=1 Tax=Absidia glauca TaxID=4829 RepID=A0A168NRJ4_ABSGL|nr:hypothetical protein [Absidia glauca]